MTFTVCIRNHLTKSGLWRGTFATEELARAYADKEAKRSRAFAEFEVCQGTPRDPGKSTGYSIRGQQ